MSRPRPRPELTGVAGQHVVRGWTRSRVLGATASVLLPSLVLLQSVLLRDTVLSVVAGVLVVVTAVSSLRVVPRPVTTTISSAGITVDRSGGPAGRLLVHWDEAVEVYVAGAWQAHSSVRTTGNQEFSLPGVDRVTAERLAKALREVR